MLISLISFDKLGKMLWKDGLDESIMQWLENCI